MRHFFRKLLRRGAMQRQMEDELTFHREMSAIHQNPIPLGNTAAIAEQGYDLWRFTFLENLWRDLVYAARGLRRSPLLVLTAIVSLGLGVGVNATMFSLGLEFLFSQPSVHDAGSLVYARIGGNSHSERPVLDFISSSGLFADVAGANEEVFSNFNNGADTRTVFSVFTTRNFFTALGVPVLLGRGYTPSDPKEVAVLSYGFWRKQFAGDPSVLGKTINLDGRLCTVVGILTAHHRTLTGFGYSPDVYIPAFLDSTLLAVYGRLKPGMTPASALAGLQTVAKRMDTEMPGAIKYAKGTRLSAIAGYARLRTESEMLTVAIFFLALLAVTGLVLLIACVNVAGVLLARASARRREIAIRLAIGASRGRLLQQLLADSLLLSLLGVAFGLVLAQVTAGLLAQIDLPLPLPIRLQVHPDWRVLLYAAFLASLAAAACGLLPAWQTVRESIASHLHRESRMRVRRVLVAAQIAISVVVLCTGILFLRNLLHSTALSPGFDIGHTVRAKVNLPPTGYDSRRKLSYSRQVTAAMAALPGVDSVAAARIVPFNGGTRFRNTLVFPENDEKVQAFFFWNAVTPEFFHVMAIPLLQGRTFDTTSSAERVAIVNPEFVHRYLGHRQPVGAVFLWGPEGKTPYRIVAVAEGTKTFTIGESPQPQLYEPLHQISNDRQELEFIVRSAIPPAAQLEAIRRILHGIEPMAGTQVEPMSSSVGLAFFPSQVGALLMGSTGVLGLLLAAVGLYGVMAYSVSRRTREIGVRVAIGAGRGDIARLVMTDSVRLTVIGTAAGLVVAILATRPLAMFLVPGLKPGDPLNFVVVALAMLAMGVAATCGPILKALHIDPITALREE